MAILAIDQGTSATKAILLDDDFQVYAKGSSPLEIDHNQSGMSQSDPLQMWQSVIDSVDQVLTGNKLTINCV